MFGVKDTLACLEMGAVETLIIWENLEVSRYVFNTSSGERLGGVSGTRGDAMLKGGCLIPCCLRAPPRPRMLCWR